MLACATSVEIAQKDSNAQRLVNAADEMSPEGNFVAHTETCTKMLHWEGGLSGMGGTISKKRSETEYRSRGF